MSGDGFKEPIPLVLDNEELIRELANLIWETHNKLAEKFTMFNPTALQKSDAIGRLESVIGAAYCTHFGIPPTERFADAFDQAACFCEHLAKDHIFHDGNKRTALLMLGGMIWLCGYDITLVDAPNPEKTTRTAGSKNWCQVTSRARNLPLWSARTLFDASSRRSAGG